MRPPRKILVREPSDGVVRELTKWEVFKIYIIEPLKLLRLLRYPPVLLAIAYVSFAFGSLVISLFNDLTVVLSEHFHYIFIFGCSI
jgi:hypothetical protein